MFAIYKFIITNNKMSSPNSSKTDIPKALFGMYKDDIFKSLLGNLAPDTTVGYINPIAFDNSIISDQYRRSVVFTFIKNDGKVVSIDMNYYPGCEIRAVDNSTVDNSNFDLLTLWHNARSYYNEPFGTRPGEKKDDGQIVDNCLYLLDPYTGEWCK